MHGREDADFLGGGHHLANTVPRAAGPGGQVHSPGQSLEEARSGQTRGAWVGCGWKVRSPTNASDFYSFFPCLVFFSVSSTSILCVVVVVILFLKRNHIWSWFSADTGTRGGTRQTQTCDRQAVCPRAAGLQTPSLSRGETSRSGSETERAPG